MADLSTITKRRTVLTRLAALAAGTAAVPMLSAFPAPADAKAHQDAKDADLLFGEMKKLQEMLGGVLKEHRIGFPGGPNNKDRMYRYSLTLTDKEHLVFLTWLLGSLVVTGQKTFEEIVAMMPGAHDPKAPRHYPEGDYFPL